jgi:hypothetical protein
MPQVIDPEWTAHDLRRTFATQLGEFLNIDLVVIEKPSNYSNDTKPFVVVVA